MMFLVKDNRFRRSRLVKPTKENTLVYTDWNIKKNQSCLKRELGTQK